MTSNAYLQPLQLMLESHSMLFEPVASNAQAARGTVCPHGALRLLLEA